MTRDPRMVQQIEVVTSVGGLVLGTVSRFGRHTQRDLRVGRIRLGGRLRFHLGQMSLVRYFSRGKPPL
ncbi:MAG: hypothetical protein ACYC91_11035 [Solirubrobacteraceae bacterium]